MMRNVLIAALVLFAAQADAKDRTLTIIAGFPVGGPSSIVARHMADTLEKELDVTVVVENKPGASGQVAAEYVKRQPTDGNTLMILASTSALKVKPDEELVPVGRISRFDFVFAVNPSTRSKTLDEYIDRVHSGEVPGDYTTPGVGSVPHLLIEQLAEDMAKKRSFSSRLPLLHIPYQGSAAAVQSVIGGHVPAAMFGLSEMKSAIEYGLVPLFIASSKRSKLLPNVPTLMELGYDIDAPGWHALYLRKGVDPAWQERLHAAVQRAAATMPEALKELGFVGDASSSQEMARIHQRDSEKWSAIAKRIGIEF